MKPRYRDWILPIIVLAILLTFTPHALYRVIKTGNPYLFTSDFFGDMLARLHGPESRSSLPARAAAADR